MTAVIAAELRKASPERRVEFMIAKDAEVQGDGRLLLIAL